MGAPLVRGSVLLFGGIVVGNLGHYLFQMYMSRNLRVEDFGALNSLLSLLALISIPSGTILLVTARQVAELGSHDAVGAFFRGTLARVSVVAASLLALSLALGPKVGKFLRVTSPLPVLILAGVVAVTLVTSAGLGVLQGLKKFFHLALNQGLAGLLRLAFGVVLSPYRLNGALLATLLSAAVVWGVSLVPLREFLRGRGGYRADLDLGAWAPVMGALFCFALLTNADLILVKHYFRAELAGIYSAASVLGKALLFLPMSVALALFPLVPGSSEVASKRTAERALILAGAGLGVGTALFLLFPGLILGLVFGRTYSDAGNILRWFGLAAPPYGLAYVLVHYHLAKWRYKFLYPMALACTAELVLIGTFHGSLLQVVRSFAGVGYGLLLGLWGVEFFRR
ncbi:MAG: hypothetical protein DRQ14_04780 [Candidatus Latescibacterota bacterium]|nr:MAG: hypothetical protein DRQ14_04780 [Candidatus Latescibacterota bacterium]